MALKFTTVQDSSVTHLMHRRNWERFARRGPARATPKGSQHAHLLCRSFNDVSHHRCMPRSCSARQPCAADPQPSTRLRMHAGGGSLSRGAGTDIFAPASGTCRAAAIRAEVRVPTRVRSGHTAEHRRGGHALRRLAFPLGRLVRSGTVPRKWMRIPVDNDLCRPQACGAAWAAERCGGHGGESIQGRRGASWTISRPSGAA